MPPDHVHTVALKALVELSMPVGELEAVLAQLPGSTEDAFVVLSKEHLVKTLTGVPHDTLGLDQIARWARLILGREDVGMTDEIKAVVTRLGAVPPAPPLTQHRVEAWVTRLSGKGAYFRRCLVSAAAHVRADRTALDPTPLDPRLFVGILERYASGSITARVFENEFLQHFKAWHTSGTEPTHEILNPVFVALEDFCPDATLRSAGDIDEAELLAVVQRGLPKLAALLSQGSNA